MWTLTATNCCYSGIKSLLRFVKDSNPRMVQLNREKNKPLVRVETMVVNVQALATDLDSLSVRCRKVELFYYSQSVYLILKRSVKFPNKDKILLTVIVIIIDNCMNNR